MIMNDEINNEGTIMTFFTVKYYTICLEEVKETRKGLSRASGILLLVQKMTQGIQDSKQ
jgi:hypothetical protein